jgi:hypothetical protein
MSTFDQSYNAALSAAIPAFKAAYVRLGDAIYHFSLPAMRKWAESPYFYDRQAASKIGKLTYVVYQGEWHRHPIDHRGHTSRLPDDFDSKERRIVHYQTTNITDMSTNEIQRALEGARKVVKNDMRHYKAFLRESKKVGWPTRYGTDLIKHDKRELTYRSPDLPVGWILRESGTHIIFPENEVDNSSRPGHQWVSIAKNSFGLENARFYAWDGVSLREMKPDVWAEWMNRKHRVLKGGREED